MSRTLSGSATRENLAVTVGRGPIDLAFLATQTGGDTELQREVLALFVTQAQDQIARLRWHSESTALLADLHRLQGSARAIGAFELSEAAGQLEALTLGGSKPPGSETEARQTLRTALGEACSFAASLQP